MDNPNFRSSHTIPTIRGGGILFYMAVALFFMLSDFKYPYFFIGISSIALISFIDDIETLSAKVRLPFQFFAIALVVYQTGLFDSSILIIISLLIVGVGFINLYNFMDGINGITGLYSLVVLSGFLLLNYNNQIVETNLLYYSILSIGVFGYYNFRKKARMFAGDIGSITLAMLVLFLGLLFLFKLEAPVIILLMLVYGLDSVLTIAYRIYLKEHIMQPHRHHIYQKLVDVKKWSHLQVSGMYAGIQLVVNVLVLVTYKLPISEQMGIVVVCIVLGVLGYVWLFKMLKITKVKMLNENLK
ncbi:MAG: glycosyltransferase family 4 protein [Lutibacter sp.]|uniref:MraY family glycosyltransferase n=1 Tax=Lutibacter sp. TaxID=1925666 RepID=UPI00299F1F37|nr:glycosyltransferase family 4 protein [Lutibacter sp.]MDX1828792.1 glycosyltransferase family 4 protein [Lutibacter sp.]